MPRASNVSQTRVQEWMRWLNATKDPLYKPKALLAVYEADGMAMLLAVLKAADLGETHKLISCMAGDKAEQQDQKSSRQGEEGLSRKDARVLEQD